MRRPGPRGVRETVRFYRDFANDAPGALLRLRERYGEVCFVGGRGTAGVVFVLGAAANEFVFRNSGVLTWRGGYQSLLPVSGETALLVSDGPGHDGRRALTQPAFTGHRVEDYLTIMIRNVTELIAGWRVGQEIDVYRAFRSVIRATVVEALFGTRLAADSERLGRDLQPALDVLNASLPAQLLTWAVPNPWRSRARSGLARVDARIAAEIADRRRRADPPDDLLTMMLAAGGAHGLDDSGLRDAVVSLVVASFDTTSAALAWAVHAALGQDGVWDRIRAEVTETVGDGPLTAPHVRRLRYTRRVVDETLRLHPPAVVGARGCTADLEFSGHRIPAGSTVVFSQYVAHTDPRVWSDPMRFRPERWDRSHPAHDDVGTFDYIPFGAGPRRCIGSALAIGELVVTLAQLTRLVELRLCSPEALPAGMTAVYPRGGMAVQILANGADPWAATRGVQGAEITRPTTHDQERSDG